MKFIGALCLLGAFVATSLAMPQDRPQVSDPIFIRPTRPEDIVSHRHSLFNMKPPSVRPASRTADLLRSAMNGDLPKHPIGNENSHMLHELMEDMRDFFNLYPRQEIRNLIREHINDPELRATVKFVRTPEFQEIMHAIAHTAEYRAIGQYFATADWPWLQETITEAVREFDAQALTVTKRSSGGLNGLLDAIVAILPKEQLRALFDDKMQNRPVFRAVVEIVTSDELMALIDAAHQSSEIRTLFGRLLNHGIDMEKIVSLRFALVGY